MSLQLLALFQRYFGSRFDSLGVARPVGTISALSVIFVLASMQPAHAYLDPGTGAMVLQLLLGGLAGMLLAVKLYFSKIKSLWGGLFGGKNAED